MAYPKGEMHTFKFSKTPLNVYQGTVTLRLPLTPLPNAPVGEQHIPLKLRYQACSTEVCLPPVTIDLQGVVNLRRARPPPSPRIPKFSQRSNHRYGILASWPLKKAANPVHVFCAGAVVLLAVIGFQRLSFINAPAT